MNRYLRITFVLIAGAAAVAAILWSFFAHREDLQAEGQSDQPIKNATRVTVSGGETVVKFDREMQQRIGIHVEPLAALTQRGEVRAYGRLEEDPSRSFILRAPIPGTVRPGGEGGWPNIGQTIPDRTTIGMIDPRLLPADRITLSDRLAASRSDVESGKAALRAAQLALDRARTLNADDKNVSDRAVQDAEVKVAAEQAHMNAASESARLIESSLSNTNTAAVPLDLIRGGEVVEVLVHPGESVESGQAILRVARFDQLFARVDVAAGETVAANLATATIVPLGREDRPVRGERVALAASIDPRTQGRAFMFRVADPSLSLRPGLSVTAFLDMPGPARAGVAVPRSSVIRQSGRAWVYVQSRSGQFARRPVDLEEQTATGWFTRSLSPGDRIVTVGAQALLSEEFKSQIQVGEENQQ